MVKVCMNVSNAKKSSLMNGKKEVNTGYNQSLSLKLFLFKQHYLIYLRK